MSPSLRPGSAFPRTLHKVSALLVVLSLGVPSLALAQGASTPPKTMSQNGTLKMIIGGGVAAVGVILLAGSHESVSANTAFGKVSASATDKGQMALGAIMAGGGGYLLYLGAKDRKAAQSPNQSFAVEVGHRNGLYLVRQW